MTDVLVTGAEGFIGGHLVPALEANGDDVTTLDISGTPDVQTDASTYDGYGQFDVIYHLAAIVNPRRCAAHPQEAWRANVTATYNLVRQLDGDQHLVFPSTDHVYGPRPLDGTRIAEDGERKPETLYGLTKLLGEEVIRHAARVDDLRYRIYRLFSVYGPGQSRGQLVPDVIEKARTQDVMAIRDPAVHQSMTYVPDAVEVMAGRTPPPGTYNLCAGPCISVEQVYRAIADHFDVECVREPGREKAACGNNAKLSRYFDDWTAFETGIEATIEAH